jgi:transcriptional regulator with XRE-family HTH domain
MQKSYITLYTDAEIPHRDGGEQMIYKKIYYYLFNNGIRQKFVSEKTGIQQSKLSLSLYGKRKIPIEEYVLICKALNVPLDKFIS